MPLTVEIPKINITPEAEEDDDHSIMNCSEALTDVEDLNEDDYEQKSTALVKKSKLKIKLTEKGDVTDLEDFEASSEEDDIPIIKHLNPVSVKDLDLEAPITEESYKTQKETNKGRKRTKTEFATKQKSFYHSESFENNDIDEGVVTDNEAYNTENEVSEADIPETELNLDLYKTENLTTNNTEAVITTPISMSSDFSDNDQTQSNFNDFVSTFSNTLGVGFQNIHEMTDFEIFNSDSDSQDEVKITKTRRRRHRSHKNTFLTDTEDLYLSDDKLVSRNIKKPKRKQKCSIKKSQSLAFDSENEENRQLPFPICKKIAKKNSPSLRIPDFDTNFLTEVEDFDGESDIEKSEMNYIDDKALEEKLREIASGYGLVTEEKSKSKKEEKKHRTENIKTQHLDTDKESTDEHEFEADDGEDNEISIKDESVTYNIKFSPSYSNLKITPANTKTQLALPITTEDTLTDCENIDSSPDELESNKIPLACIQNQYQTDEDELSNITSSIEDNYEELVLPFPTRNLVIIQENDSLIPTVRILPLDNVIIKEESVQDEEQITDEENMSEVENASNLLEVEQPARAPTPDLPILDGGLINVSENLNNYRTIYSPIPNESVTDTEEVILDKKHKRKRAPKFKYLHEKTLARKNQISPNQENIITLHTDTKDICLSDNAKDKSCPGLPFLNLPHSANFGFTDTENIDLSGDEQEYYSQRPFSATPEHMKEMGGNTVFLKEGSGPFSIIDKLELNRFSLKAVSQIVTPATTDSEDVMVSAEEDIENSYSRAATATPNHIHQKLDQTSAAEVKSELGKQIDLNNSEEVMYLKGGGYNDEYTDIEFLFGADEVEMNPKYFEKNVGLNFKTYSVMYENKEWDTSKKPTNITESHALEKDASQQGDDQTSHTGPQPGSSSVKAESEEARDKAEKEKSTKVTDLHQLSGEMKELLQEMEREAKK